MRILVFGGSFDPPHVGHSALLKSASRALRPDRILIVPAYHAPLKGAPPNASAQDRLAMIREGLLPSLPPRVRRLTRVDRTELDSRRRVFTVDTLARLKRLHPRAEFHFAVGSDGAASFGRWKDPRRLKSLCRWWTALRPGAKRPPSFFTKLNGRMPDISSTELRRRLALGEDVSRWVARRTLSLIVRKGLYGTPLLKRLETSLTPERFLHSVAVARVAVRLAERWGQGPEKARLAGLLHDCGRAVPVHKMPDYVIKHRIKVPLRDQIIRQNPLLLHAYISARIAGSNFAVFDREILNAIERHTLGARRMTALDRVLYVADSTSEDRAYPGVRALRSLAFRDLDRAFRRCARQKIIHARSRGGWIHPLTLSLWNSRPG